MPWPVVWVDYYRSLLERTQGYDIDISGKLGDDAEIAGKKELKNQRFATPLGGSSDF